MTLTLHMKRGDYEALEAMRKELKMSWAEFIIYAKKKWEERHGALTPDSFTTDQEKVD